jgi:hypothetical protein
MQLPDQTMDDLFGSTRRGFDLVGGLRAVASAVAMTVNSPSPDPETVAVCTTCGRVPNPNGGLVDLSTALAGRRHVRFDHALCCDCFEADLAATTRS